MSRITNGTKAVLINYTQLSFILTETEVDVKVLCFSYFENRVKITVKRLFIVAIIDEQQIDKAYFLNISYEKLEFDILLLSYSSINFYCHYDTKETATKLPNVNKSFLKLNMHSKIINKEN